MEAPTSSTKNHTHCTHCQKAQDDLKHCGKCKSVGYCDRGCQKAHWKVHKKDCTRLAAQRAGNNAPIDPDSKPFTALHNNVYLHNRPEDKTFQILIDCLRMRQEDEYSLDGNIMSGSVYDGDRNTSEEAFRTFLRKAQQTSGLLPLWWTDAKSEECTSYGLRQGHGFSLACAVEKPDVQEAWKDNQMPMKLRLLAEKVYGNTPGGHKGDAMLQLMMTTENGQNFSETLDMFGRS